MEPRTPLGWILAFVKSVQWPAVVCAAFWLGRYVQRLEARVERVESWMRQLMDRHMPAIHEALAEVLGRLAGRA